MLRTLKWYTYVTICVISISVTVYVCSPQKGHSERVCWGVSGAVKSQLATHATGNSETRQRFQGRWAAAANAHTHRSLEIVKNETVRQISICCPWHSSCWGYKGLLHDGFCFLCFYLRGRHNNDRSEGGKLKSSEYAGLTLGAEMANQGIYRKKFSISLIFLCPIKKITVYL